MKNTSYDDIIHLPHFRSAKKPHMDMHDRAAQFLPFMALSGYDAEIQETARLTSHKLQLDEDTKAVLDMKLHLLSEKIEESPEVSITCFLADSKKAGGRYETVTDTLKKIDEYHRIVVLADGTNIDMDDILEIESELFNTII